MKISQKGSAKLLLLIIAVIAIGVAVYYYTQNDKNKTATTVASISYPTQSECQSKTGKQCRYMTCDFIPRGKTVEELCGQGFKNGWQPTVSPATIPVSTSTSQIPEDGTPIPVIESIYPTSGHLGEYVTIRGQHLSGFEGDLDVYFERSDGKRVLLTDAMSYPATQDKLIYVRLKQPCDEGETVYGRYSGNPEKCNYVAFTPGVYKVYVEPWGKKSNFFQFTVTPTPTVWETYTNQEYGISFKYPPVAEEADLNEEGGVIRFVDLPIIEKGTNLGQKYLDIHANPIPKDGKGCSANIPTEGALNSSTNVVFNGISYLKQTGGEGAAGSSYNFVSYVTSKYGKCYVISLVLVSANDLKIPTYDNPYAKPYIKYNAARESAILDQIMSTFKFTN
jgi:hypothetical protein